MDFSAVVISSRRFFVVFYEFGEAMTLFIIISFILILGLQIMLLYREGVLNEYKLFISAVILSTLTLGIRAFLLTYESGDYLSFLAPWTQFLRENGGFAALRYNLGNYNPPYMYFLALFSYFKISELYLIKITSIVFDVLLAWACMKLLSLFTDSKAKLLSVFFVVLLFPTVLLNGAYWAQCDSIYTFFGVYALYLGLNKKGAASMVSLAASLAFKLQAVFIIPAFFPLLLAKKLKWRDIFVFPLAYIVFMLPAVIEGRPFFETLTLYFSQAGTVGTAMNYNAPSLTSIFSFNENSSSLLVIAAFILVLIVYAVSFLKRRELDNRLLLGLTLLLAMGIPFLLPHMHDRYFFMSGMLAIVLAMTDMRFVPVPIFAELASLHCYYAYFNGYYLVAPRHGGELMIFALALTVIYIIFSGKSKKDNFFEIKA